MFGVKVFCKIDLTENFHHEHFIDPTNCPWVSEDKFTVECVANFAWENIRKYAQDFYFIDLIS